MSSGVEVTGRVDELHTRLTALIDDYQALDTEALSSDEVLELLRGMETAQRRLLPVQHAAIGQLEARSLAFERGAKNTAILLTMMLRIARPEAGRRVKAARLLAPRRTVTGLPVDPQYPLVAAAQADGSIGAEHAAAITDMMSKLPDEVVDTPRTAQADPEDTGDADAATVGDWLEAHLTGQARMSDPQQLSRHARQLQAALDQDGLLREYQHRENARSLDLHVRPDGSATLRGELTAELTEQLLTCLDVFAAPTPSTDGNGQPVPDPRTATQRRHDALGAMLRRLGQARLLGDRGGITATLVLTMDAEVYATSTPEHSTGLALTGHGYQIPAGKAKTWLRGETQVIGVVLSKTKGIQAYSTLHRLATEPQRLAVFARDRGCFGPACDTPLLQTETHHITDWKNTLNRYGFSAVFMLCCRRG